MHPVVRAAWYAAYEPLRLRLARRADRLRFDIHERGLFDWHWTKHPCPLVSVIIPTHNRVDLLLERCLPSIVRQTYPNIEVIVSAHGCTDGTEQAVHDFFAESRGGIFIAPEFLKIISTPRCQTYPPTPENHWYAGPVAPINAGLKVARGAWIARIDDDDTWTPDHLARLLNFAEAGNYEFVSAAHKTHKGKVEPYRIGDVNIGGVQTWLYRSYLKSFKANPDCWRKKTDRVNDTDMQARFVKAGVRMGYLDKVVAEVLPRPGEDSIGLEAYRRDAPGKMRHFAFE